MPQDVIAAVEALSASQRWRHMLALGRRAASEPDIKRQIDALAASPDFYPRLLALMSSFASGDPAILVDCLTGPSADLFGLAYNVAARRLDDATLAALFPKLPKRRRVSLARACAKAGRTAAIEGAFAQLGRDDQARLLAYASAQFVEARLGGELVELLSPDDWGRLAARHPALGEAALSGRFAETADPSFHLLAATNAALLRMGCTAPERALALLHVAARRAPLSRFHYARLTNLYPKQICQLILADAADEPPDWPPALMRRIDDEARQALLRLRPAALSPREFQRLKPESRQRLWPVWTEASRGAEGALPEAIVAALPREERHREARHAWRLPEFAAYPARRLPFLAFLPFDEALREASPFASQPDAELRALANAKIVAAGRYEPSRLPAILEHCRAKRNEQDPVRLAMLIALAQLPPSRWQAEHLPAIRSIVDDALAARDCSYPTMTAAARLLMGMAPAHFNFVAPELSRLVERMGGFYRADLRHRFSDAQTRALAPHVLPLLTTWRARSYTGAAIAFLAGFGERLKAAPELIDFVAGLTADPRRDVAEPALNLLVGVRAGALLDTLVPRLLADDPSWIGTAVVARLLHRQRQDLLTPFLAPRAYQGRFATAGTRIVPDYRNGFSRWTQSQQRIYADALIEIASSGRRSAWELRRAIAALAAMPAIAIDSIARFAALDVADVALRDTALAALGRADAARGAPALVAALTDARARVAIYALRRIVLDMPNDRAIALLRSTSLAKVTVAKEVVRLAGELEGDEAYRFISGFLERPETHADVRIAAMRALWAHLERPEAWDVFAAAARDGDPAAARATIRIPQDRLSPAARRRLAEHMVLLARHPSPLVRLETLRRLIAMPLAETAPALTSALVEQLANPTDEEAGLVAAALARATRPEGAAALADTFAGVAAPRALQAIVEALIGEAGLRRERTLPFATALVDRLFGRRRQIGLATRLALCALPPRAALATLRPVAEAGALHPGAVMEAIQAAPRLVRRRGAEAFAAVEPAFGDAPQPAMRRIGLALLCANAAADGWSRVARQRLDAYRADRDAWIGEAAALTVPPEAPIEDR